ncbi:heme-binding chloroplastic [Chlorella sorokiniana]|uniref:Heme-binding chloroplastic n=1 Tax=Chlorella sorokiniana TaxID=3076 RepID=A0A2P6TJR9_CHLSO|nr:heme-binding chloroplastic [Chlorella sorokiniana]|eukprot:PRW44330.1 heme-binding chloroplastic [Chlorella sorokiniana]
MSAACTAACNAATRWAEGSARSAGWPSSAARRGGWWATAAPPARRRSARAVAPAALFGFGSKPAEQQQQAAPAPAVQSNSPLLIPFTPVQKNADYSLRLYSAYTAAECEYERRDEGFLLLGSYMSGNNAADARCRETQPVVMCYPPQGAKRMRIHIVPAGSSDAALPPAPRDPAVTLAVAGGEVVAARQFEGNATKEACERCLAQLKAALARDGLQLAEAEAGGFFRLAQYGPLHSLSTRVNEIWLAVKL